MIRRRSLFGALALTLFLQGASCDSSNDRSEAQLAALEILETFPAAAVDVRTPPGVQTVSVTFNRPPVFAPVFQMAPEPPSAGTPTPSVTGRIWSWPALDLRLDDGAYYWLIDAPELDQPFVVPIVMSGSGRLPRVGFAGTIASADTNLVQPQGTIVFAIDTDTGFNPLDPASFLGTSPHGLALASGRNIRGDAQYILEYMEIGRSVLAVAIVDSDGDQVYDPTRDWWGFYEDPDNAGLPGIIPPLPFDDPEVDAIRNARITLQPPN